MTTPDEQAKERLCLAPCKWWKPDHELVRLVKAADGYSLSLERIAVRTYCGGGLDPITSDGTDCPYFTAVPAAVPAAGA